MQYHKQFKDSALLLTFLSSHLFTHNLFARHASLCLGASTLLTLTTVWSGRLVAIYVEHSVAMQGEPLGLGTICSGQGRGRYIIASLLSSRVSCESCTWNIIYLELSKTVCLLCWACVRKGPQIEFAPELC